MYRLLVIFWCGLALAETAVTEISSIEADKAIKTDLAVKSSNIQEIQQGQINFVIIKGRDVGIKVSAGKEAKFVIDTNANVSVSRNGKFLIIDGLKNNEISCNMTVPAHTSMRILGGKVNLDIENVNGNLDVTGGAINCRANGPLQNVKMSAGSANIDVKGIQRNFALTCGEGTVSVSYDLTDYLKHKQAKGLTFLSSPSVILSMAAGKADFFFPEKCKLSYLKDIPGVIADEKLVKKDWDVKVSISIVPETTKVYLHNK